MPISPGVIRLFSTDLDGTLIGDPVAMDRFKICWENLPRDRRPLLVYNSGRRVMDILRFSQAKKLPAPDYIIGGVGTEFHDAQRPVDVPEFLARFGDGWDLSTVEQIVRETPGVERQPPEFLHPYKSSWFLNRADRGQIEELRRRLTDAGLQVAVVYSSLRHLDVLPVRANKGNALLWLCRRLSIPSEAVLVAGDTGNDSSMFLVPGVKGIVVGNAQPELFESAAKLPVFISGKAMADGVLDGLEHFGILGDGERPD